MSGAQAITRSAAAAAAPPVEAAIRHAAQATGVDFSYLLGQARLESSLNPGARAGTSSAAGLYQFTRGTWLATLDAHAARHGYGWADAAIVDGKVADPALRTQVLNLRFDPQASALMAAELAADNRDHLRGVLGREPDAAELYLAHFLGAEGAGGFLRGLASNPAQSAAALLPKAAEANRAIFFDGAGRPRSLDTVMGVIRAKMDRAMGAEPGDGPGLPAGGAGGDTWGAFAAAPAFAAGQGLPGDAGPALAASPPRASMADTLASAFGGTDAALPGTVRSAYAKLRAFGL